MDKYLFIRFILCLNSLSAIALRFYPTLDTINCLKPNLILNHKCKS